MIPVRGGRVWTDRVGDGPGAPLLLLHGGPGSSTASYGPLAALGSRRPVIFYDQLGSYRSEKPEDLSLWTAERFVEELREVRAALGLRNLHILGHSWGAMLLALYLRDEEERDGVLTATFSSPCLDVRRWASDQAGYLMALPLEMQEALRLGDEESPGYRAAVDEFYARHLVRKRPVPEGLRIESENLNHTVYRTMWGPTEFYPTGNLKDFDATPWLGEIGTPSLFLCGRYDEAAPTTVGFHASLMPNAEFHVFEASGHKSYAEEPESYLRVLEAFLDRWDPPGA